MEALSYLIRDDLDCEGDNSDFGPVAPPASAPGRVWGWLPLVRVESEGLRVWADSPAFDGSLDCDGTP